MGRYEDALPDYNRAIELAPRSSGLFIGRGQGYRMMERYKEALADYNRAINLGSSPVPVALLGRGQTYEAMGRHECPGGLQPRDRAHARFCPGPPPEVSALPDDGA
jgi:tetratricopeptide (TPR) repeat protein